MENNVLRLIRNLPACDGKFGTLAVPFVTYGGVHSSVALDEAGRLLKKKKRKSILGVKIAAEHTLTKTASKIICESLPGENEEKIIAEAVEKNHRRRAESRGRQGRRQVVPLCKTNGATYVQTVQPGGDP